MSMDQALVDRAIAAWEELQRVTQSHDSIGELVSRHLGGLSLTNMELFCQWSSLVRSLGYSEGKAEAIAAQLLALWPEGEATVGVMSGGIAYLLMRTPQGIQVMKLGDGMSDQSTQDITHGTQ